MLVDHPHDQTVHTLTAFDAKFVYNTDLVKTGPLISHKTNAGDVPAPYNSFRQYSWTATAPFQKLMRDLWRYIQSFEDEHYQIYFKRNVNEETLRDYSSAIQEIIPRMAKVQSVLNHNSRGFPDMLRWTPPTAEPMHVKHTIKDSAQDCEEFSIMAHDAANKPGLLSSTTAGAIVQSALACQAAASKAAIALQRTKFGDPVCDPGTVMQKGSAMNSLLAIVSGSAEKRRLDASAFLA